MAKPGLWNDNRFRSYPFIKGETGKTGAGTIENVPFSTIVDAGFTMGLDSGYVAGEHSVWLELVSRSGDTVTFRFESDAPGLFNRPLVFTRDVDDDLYQLEYVDSLVEVYDSASASLFEAGLLDDELFLTLTDGEWLLVDDSWYVTGDGSTVSASFSYDGDDDCDVQPLWSGFLVTGDLAELVDLLVDGTTWTGNEAIVEPAVVDSLVDAYASSVNVGNADRTRVTPADGCPDIEWDYPVGEDVVHVNQSCLQGHIRFKPGYNAVIEQVDTDNQIFLGASPGEGEGLPGSRAESGVVCDGVQLFDAEIPPDGSTLYEGGPRCNEVLRSINGLGGQLLSLLTGAGVEITEIPAENKIIVDVSMRTLAVCYEEVSAVSESV